MTTNTQTKSLKPKLFLFKFFCFSQFSMFVLLKNDELSIADIYHNTKFSMNKFIREQAVSHILTPKNICRNAHLISYITEKCVQQHWTVDYRLTISTSQGSKTLTRCWSISKNNPDQVSKNLSFYLLHWLCFNQF